MMVAAPTRARFLAMAKPMPSVEPVTRAVFPVRSIYILYSYVSLMADDVETNIGKS
jgi:hypothetical protein